MNKQEILNKLDKAKFYQELIPSLKVNAKPEALGLCPFHDDHNPSMSVNLKSGLYHCHVCGAGGDVFNFYMQVKGVDFPTALREIGAMAGVVEADIKSKVVATFRYTDEAGNVLYIKERLEPGHNGRSKEFFFKHLENGKRVSGRGGDPVLYNLPELIKSKYAFIVEGEAKADLLNSWGLTATCLDNGANSPWKDEYLKVFEGKEKVVILPDNDEPGAGYALKIANALHGKVKELKIIELPGLGEAEDIINWSKTPGNDKSKLMELIKDAPLWTPKKCEKHNIKISTIAEMLEYSLPEYLIKPILYKNTVNLLQSLPGVGKSLVVLSIADAITSNKLLWGHFDVIEKGKVLIVDEENPGSIHRDRLEKMSIDKDALIHFIHYQGVKIDDPQWLELLIKFIDEGKYVLVVFDALIRMHGAKENDSDEMSKVMWGFREIVRRGNTTVLIIHHERKSRDGEKRERSRGSGDIIGAIDSQLILEEGVMSDNGKELSLHPGKTRLKSFTPIRLLFNQDTLNINYVGNVLSGSKVLTQSIVQFLGDGIRDFEAIQQALCIPEKQLREIIKNALGKELILDSSIKQHSDYKGSPKKQFYKVNPSLSIFSRGNVSPIGGETCHIEEKRPSGNKVSGNMDSLDSVGCGVVSEHGLPHETLTKKHVSEGVKKEGVGNMKNSIETEEILEVEFVEVILNV